MAASNRTLVITLQSDEPERVAVALTVGSTAVVSGVAVQLFLIHDAVRVAPPGALEEMTVPHSPPPAEMMQRVLGAGSPVYACTQCMARRGMNAADLRDGIVQGGAPQLVAALSLDGAQSLSF